MAEKEPTKAEIEQAIEMLVLTAKMSEQGKRCPTRETALALGVLVIDRYMRHGGNLPKRWVERRTKCHVTFSLPQGKRCMLEKGHGGRCEP